MTLNQVSNIKKIMESVDRDYRATEQLAQRQIELDEALKHSYFSPAFNQLLSHGVRPEILSAAMESPEFEETLSAFVSELTGIIARWDFADHIDSERDAA